MLTSRMDEKNRVRIPAEVLVALGVKPGDPLVYEIDGAVVVVRARTASDPPAR